MLMYLVFSLLTLGMLWYLYSRNYSYWESKGVPYAKPFFIFGSFYKIAARRQNLFERIKEIYQEHNLPYVGIYIFNQPTLMVRSPEILKKILVHDFDKFRNRKVASDEKADPISFHFMFSSRDMVWKNMRSKISPVFTSGKMKMMLPLMKECADDLVSYTKKHDGETLDFKIVAKKYAVDVIASCAFGINANCLKTEEDSEVYKVAAKLVDFTSFKRNFSTFSFFFLPKLVSIFKLTFVDKESSDYLFNIFKNTLKQREEKKIVRNDLIDLLNNLRNTENTSDGYKFDELKMASQAIIFFFAGNETTASTISFVLYELALNPEIQDNLCKEVREVFVKHGDFTYEAIQEMKYLDMVLKEGLRKYPFNPFLNRECVQNYTIEDGFTLEKGLSVIVPLAGLHYDPAYFPDPDKFDPERFSDENKGNINPCTYMPFGHGPRNCIGERFANLVSKVALASIIKDFDVKATNQTSIPLEYETSAIFLQNKEGIKLKVVSC